MSSLTLLEVLKRSTSYLQSKSIDTARLDAELLLAHALKTDRLGVYLRHDQPMNEEDLAVCRSLMGRRARRVPVAYLLGYKEFMGHSFRVSPAVLVPRPDTETLVEVGLEIMRSQSEPGWVLDVGTGSGCIACSLLMDPETLGWNAVATDRSWDAIQVARENGMDLGVPDRLSLVCCDLVEGIGSMDRFDLVTANLPYIPSLECEALAPEISRYEPRLALDGGKDGLILVDRLLRQLKGRLRKGSCLLLEVGYGQAGRVVERMKGMGFAEVRVALDLAGIERVVVGQCQ